MLRSQQQLSSIFKASRAGANARVMLDSGAAANCISEDFCNLMKIKILPMTGASITTADGKTSSVKGTAVVKLTLQAYKAELRFLVIPMAPDCDAILGEPWHTSTRAVSTYGPMGLTNVKLYKGRSVRKLTQHPAESRAWESSPGLLNHLQFAKAAEHNAVFVAYVNIASGQPGDESSESDEPSGSNNPEANDPTDNLEPAMKNLLQKYKIVFDKLPKACLLSGSLWGTAYLCTTE